MGVRPTYEKVVKPYLSKIISWRREGAKIEWIAKQFHIATSTFYEWKKKYPEFAESLKNGVDGFYDDLVVTAENTLFEKLVDRMVVVEKTEEKLIDKYGKVTEHIVEKKKLIPADTTAIIFALKNRKPKIWNNSEHELSVAKIEKVRAEIERLGNSEDLGSIIMQSLKKYTDGDNE